MIFEALTWLLTPAPDWARQTGYLKELVALQARHRRWRREWAPHHEMARKVILDSMAHCRSARHALVYGSGLLQDIPLPALAGKFDRVTLVDVAHLWPQRLSVRRYDNVRLAERDISGVAMSLLHGVAKGADRIPPPQPKLPEDHAEIDFVVSANCLSQLSIIPMRFLAKNFSLTEELANAYATDIARAHLQHLNAFGGVRCLITDIDRQFVDRDGAVQQSEPQFPGLTLPDHQYSWDWELAPYGEISREFSLRTRVVAATMLPGNAAGV